MRQTRIIVLALIAVVLVVGVVVGKNLLTAKPGEQKGEWQTYTDNVQKYQFSYPAGWFLYKGNPNQLTNYDSEKASPGQFDPEKDKEKIKIEIYSTDQPYESIEKYLEEQESGERMYQEPSPTYEPTVLNGQSGLKAVEKRLGGLLSIYIKNPKTGYIHSITAMPNYDLHKAIVDQIVATFKFLKQEEVIEESSFSEYGVYYANNPRTQAAGPVFGYPYIYGSRGPYENYVKLIFTDESVCHLDREEKPCGQVKFANEMVLKISGQKVGEEVRVFKVETPGD